MLYACDRRWWLEHHDAAHARCGAEFWTANHGASKVFNINFVRAEPGGGLASRRGWIRQGGNSGFQAVGLALLFGASRIILVGYDMQFSGGRKHWHGDHPEAMGNPLPKKFADWRQRFAELAHATKVPIVNASRETALNCFPRMDLDACLAEPAPRRS